VTTPQIDIDQLEALAKAAMPGKPLDPHPCSVRCFRVGVPIPVDPGERCSECSWRGIRETSTVGFHAAASPSAVLTLIAELRALRAQAQDGGWIRCSERMPENTERIWFYGNGRVMKGEYREPHFCTSAGFAWDGPELTHWMHRDLEPRRPSPPEEP